MERRNKGSENRFGARKDGVSQKPSGYVRQNGQEDLERLEGRNSVLEALKAGRSINRILMAKGEKRAP